MRKVLVSLMVLSLAPAFAGAAITNPEGFEGYALTTDWIPTVIGEGWIRYGELGVPQEGSSIEIQTGSFGNDTQVLKVDTYHDGAGSGENLIAEWYQNTPDAAVALTETSVDFCPTEIWNGSEHRVAFSRVPLDTWLGYRSWGITIGYGSWWGGGPGRPLATFSCFDHTDDPGGADIAVFNNEEILGINGEFDPDLEPGPGTYKPWESAVPEVDAKWWTIEVEEDNVLSKSRARIYDKSTTPGAEEGWTSWLAHSPDEHGLDYAAGGKVFQYTNGIAEWDNFSMTEEPGGDPCNPGDANNDLLVSADDYASVQGAFGNTGAIGIPGDANCDGLVSADDYASVQGNFGTTYGGAPIPEPATMLLLAAGSLMLVRRKRR